MNVPGYNYLGPGNPLRNGEPVNKTDRIAQEHDYKYDVANSENEILKADENAIKKFWQEFRNSWTPGAFIGATGLYIKNQFEKKFGVVYPNKESMSNKGIGLSLKRKREETEAINSNKKSEIGEYEITPSLINEFIMESMDQPDNGNNIVGSIHEGTNKQNQSTEQFKKTISYVSNPKPAQQTITFQRSRIMRSWGNAHFVQKPLTDKNNYRLGTSLVWLPVEYIEFYMSEAEWDSLPYGARVEHVKVKITPIGSNVCFNTNAASSVWTNSTQTIFGYHSVGFNKSGWIEPFKIKTRTNDKPMVLTDIEKVDVKKDWERLWTYEEPDTLLPMTTGVIRSIPWYTQVHYPPKDPHAMKGNWDISKYITQWEFHSHCGMPLINYAYTPKNGHTKHFIFPHYADTTKCMGTDNILSTFITTGQKNGIQVGQTAATAKTETSKYRSLIEAYGRVENGLNIQQTLQCQPSVHFGLMAVQSNAPDEGLDSSPEFVNASALWQIDSEIVWTYNHNYYNLMEMSKGNAEQFSVDVKLTPDQYYNNVNFIGRPCFK